MPCDVHREDVMNDDIGKAFYEMLAREERQKAEYSTSAEAVAVYRERARLYEATENALARAAAATPSPPAPQPLRPELFEHPLYADNKEEDASASSERTVLT
jgi:hypothetical protein